MKIRAIINVIKANNTYLNKIKFHKQQYNYFNAFDDAEGMKSEQIKINELNEEYNQFLNIEI